MIMFTSLNSNNTGILATELWQSYYFVSELTNACYHNVEKKGILVDKGSKIVLCLLLSRIGHVNIAPIRPGKHTIVT